LRKPPAWRKREKEGGFHCRKA